jgi:hypothetical protein
VSRLRNIWGFLLLISSVLLLYSFLPIGKAFSFSNDEGFGVMEAFLYNHGFLLYQNEGILWKEALSLF